MEAAKEWDIFVFIFHMSDTDQAADEDESQYWWLLFKYLFFQFLIVSLIGVENIFMIYSLDYFSEQKPWDQLQPVWEGNHFQGGLLLSDSSDLLV